MRSHLKGIPVIKVPARSLLAKSPWIFVGVVCGILLSLVFGSTFFGACFGARQSVRVSNVLANTSIMVQSEALREKLNEMEKRYEVLKTLQIEKMVKLYLEESRQNSGSCEPRHVGGIQITTELKKMKDFHESTVKKWNVTNGMANSASKVLSNSGASTSVMDTPVREVAGEFGTVVASRTSPTIISDRSVNPALADILEKVAINNEVIVGLATIQIINKLNLLLGTLKSAGVKNYIILALDDKIAEHCKRTGHPYYRKKYELTESQKKVRFPNLISNFKFVVLREFLQLGYSVLLTDIDVLFLQNPFHHLHRDCDVEGMTDGFDTRTAYGYTDVFWDSEMLWSARASTMRIFVFNSGFFYIRPTVASIELLDRVTRHLKAHPHDWDQVVYNQKLFFPSSPIFKGLHVSKRVMDYHKFMNSKVLFKFARKDPAFAKFLPVVVHMNYHPDKLPRMMATIDYYVNGNKTALAHFGVGSKA